MMNEPHDPNQTVDVSSTDAGALDVGQAAPAGKPRSSFGMQPPVQLREPESDGHSNIKPDSDAMPKSSETGNRYQLAGEIARGGMGAVLRGRDVDLGRDLAVKVLLEKYATRPDVARRFVEEAQIGGQLQHPGVVPVYDIGRFGDRPFFTMKLVKGRTLAAMLRERADSAQDRPQLIHIALRVVQTIAYAHAKGVIHRDLKPANVMIGAFGEVQVMDWGLAKVLAEGGSAHEEQANRQLQTPEDVTTIRTVRSSGSSSGLGSDTEAGSLLGTPAYIPPEQANGNIANLDRRADVFGLGAILCELLTGKPPYIGRSADEVRRKAANGDLADALARLKGSGADPEVIALTRACLAPEAVDRPKDAQAVAESLTAYVDGVQDRLHRVELERAAAEARAEAEARARTAAEGRAWAERRARRIQLALAASIMLAVSLGTAGWLWVKGERDARQARIAKDVNDALNKAASLREQAKVSKVGAAALFAQLREQAQRASALVESGSVDPELMARVTRLRDELAEEERDRKLIAALEEARLAQAETVTVENRFANELAVPLFREAFRAYGLPVGEGEPAQAAARIRQRPEALQDAFTAALSEWIWLESLPQFRAKAQNLDWLGTVFSALEPESPDRKLLLSGPTANDSEKRTTELENLAKSIDVRKVPAPNLVRLSQMLPQGSAVGLLRRAQLQYPGDFWINNNLGLALEKAKPPDFTEAIRFQAIAVALRPDSPGALLNLGLAMKKAGKVEEASACFRKAIELNPNYSAAHSSLGTALRESRQLNAAMASYRKAIELDPKNSFALHGLGAVQADNGQLDEAIANYQKALGLEVNSETEFNLGVALHLKERVDDAIACYRRAIAINPKHVHALSNLGSIYCDARSDYDEAIKCFQKALESDDKNVVIHINLGIAHQHKGQIDDAMRCYRKALELDAKNSKALLALREVEPLAAAQEKWLSYKRGEYKPATPGERIGLARFCQEVKRLFCTAATLYAAAFDAEPKVANDLSKQHRYNAACCAALAAAGQGEDAAKLDDQERTRLRNQALDWLRRDLVVYSKQLESGADSRALVQQRMKHWQQDTDLAGIRGKDALTKLPGDERQACAKLWSDVAALLAKSRSEPAR